MRPAFVRLTLRETQTPLLIARFCLILRLRLPCWANGRVLLLQQLRLALITPDNGQLAKLTTVSGRNGHLNLE